MAPRAWRGAHIILLRLSSCICSISYPYQLDKTIERCRLEHEGGQSQDQEEEQEEEPKPKPSSRKRAVRFTFVLWIFC